MQGTFPTITSVFESFLVPFNLLLESLLDDDVLGVLLIDRLNRVPAKLLEINQTKFEVGRERDVLGNTFKENYLLRWEGWF